MLGYVKVKLSKFDVYYMTEHVRNASNNNFDLRRFKVILSLNSVSNNGLINIDDDLADSLKSIRKYIVMQQSKMSFLERLFFKLELNGVIQA